MSMEESSSSSSVSDKERVNYFDLLPDEMLEKLLDTAMDGSNSKGLNLRMVCRRWNSILLPKLQFSGVLNDESIRTLASISSDIPLKIFNIHRLSANQIVDEEIPGSSPDTSEGATTFSARLFRRSVEHLIIGGDFGCVLKSEEEQPPFSLSTGFAENHELCNQLVTLPLLGSDLKNLLPNLLNVKTLTLSSLAFFSVAPHIPIWKQLDFSPQFSTLTTLDICIGQKTDITKIADFLDHAQCSHITSFYVRVYGISFNLFLNILCYRFIARNPLLKNLSLSQSNCLYQEFPVIDEDSRLLFSSYPNLRCDLMKIKLDCLRIDIMMRNHPVLNGWRDLERDFIRNQTSLKSLEIQFCARSRDGQIQDLIPECGETLERLEISSFNKVFNHFDCRAISKFKKVSQCHFDVRTVCPNVFAFTERREFLPVTGISFIHLLPPSVTSLHLGEMPCFIDIPSIASRLVNVTRISYIGPGPRSYRPMEFVLYIMEHLKIPSLIDFRIYNGKYPILVSILNSHKGLISFEENDGIVILVDREEFSLEELKTDIRLYKRVSSGDVRGAMQSLI